VLQIDMGNSTIKWRSRAADGGDGAVTPISACTHQHWLAEVAAGQWLRPLVQTISEVQISCVAGDKDARRCAEYCSALGIKRVRFASSHATWRTLKCGYEAPGQLGVDRWLAIIAAWHRTAGAVLVIDAGTALTLDTVDAHGQHLGGLIVPGMPLLQSSLLGATSRIIPRGQALVDHQAPFGRSTSAAVERGITAMTVAFIRSEIAQFCDTWPMGRVYLTGGGAEDLLQHFSSLSVEPALVLNGLGLYFAEQP